MRDDPGNNGAISELKYCLPLCELRSIEFGPSYAHGLQCGDCVSACVLELGRMNERLYMLIPSCSAADNSSAKPEYVCV
jgi:hypothetical protein